MALLCFEHGSLCSVLAGLFRLIDHITQIGVSVGGSTPGGEMGPPEFSVTSGLLSGLDFLSPVLALIALSLITGWAA